MSVLTPLPTDLIGLAEASGLVPSRKPGKKVSTSTVYRWIERGQLPGFRLGRYWFVSRQALLGLFVASEPLPEVKTRSERRREIEVARERFRAS